MSEKKPGYLREHFLYAIRRYAVQPVPGQETIRALRFEVEDGEISLVLTREQALHLAEDLRVVGESMKPKSDFN